MKSPLSLVKEKFGDKEKLVAAVEKFTTDDLWVARENKEKGLAHVSNAKLLRLHALFTAVKEKFGTRDKLIDAICELEKRVKDEGFKKRLSAFPVPRLWDMYRSADKRNAPKGPKPAGDRTPQKQAKSPAPKKATPPKSRRSPSASPKAKSRKK
jgi:hypothetical protein